MHLTDARTALAAAPAPTPGRRGPRGRLPPARSRAGTRPGRRRPRAPSCRPGCRPWTTAARADRPGPAAPAHGPRGQHRGRRGAARRRTSGPWASRRSADPADWYGAVARFSGADDTRRRPRPTPTTSTTVIRSGEARTTDDGQRVALRGAAGPGPRTPRLHRARPAHGRPPAGAECPTTVSCEWIPAPYEAVRRRRLRQPRPRRPARVAEHQVHRHPRHRGRAGTTALNLVQDPTYVSWNYSLRSTDGHIAQHVKAKDVGWHAGNWYVNAKSIGLEHEGFLAAPDAWYTEAMYRTSARLVRYLAAEVRHPAGPAAHPRPRQRARPDRVDHPRDAHRPGPVLGLGALLRAAGPRRSRRPAGGSGAVVTIRPDYAANRPVVHGLRHGRAWRARSHGSGDGAAVHRAVTRRRRWSRTSAATAAAPHHGRQRRRRAGVDRPAVRGRRTGRATGRRSGTSARRPGSRTPRPQPTAVATTGLVVTPKDGRDSVPVYGRAYPEAGGVPGGRAGPGDLPAAVHAARGSEVRGRRQGARASTTTPSPSTGDSHQVVVGKDQYYEIQFGHRVEYVRAADVKATPAT